MTRTVACLVLLLWPTLAMARADLPISCDDLNGIIIMRSETKYMDITSDDGYAYALLLKIKEASREPLARIYDAAPPSRIPFAGGVVTHTEIAIIANGTVIRSDAPPWDSYHQPLVIITKLRKDDAFAAARTICPSMVPDTFIDNRDL
ncbi:MAG: hypothetical protein AB7E47_09965 [Desulfovibrionaceae bacterium]